jgi:hypothetical protein
VGIAGANYDTFEAIFSPPRDSSELSFANRTATGSLNDA